MELDNQELEATRKLDCILHISKALKCKTCGKYIVSDEELYKYDTCSNECRDKYYRKEYRIKLKK